MFNLAAKKFSHGYLGAWITWNFEAYSLLGLREMLSKNGVSIKGVHGRIHTINLYLPAYCTAALAIKGGYDNSLISSPSHEQDMEIHDMQITVCVFELRVTVLK